MIDQSNRAGESLIYPARHFDEQSRSYNVSADFVPTVMSFKRHKPSKPVRVVQQHGKKPHRRKQSPQMPVAAASLLSYTTKGKGVWCSTIELLTPLHRSLMLFSDAPLLTESSESPVAHLSTSLSFQLTLKKVPLTLQHPCTRVCACVRACMVCVNVCVCSVHSSVASADCNCNSSRDWRVKWMYTSIHSASRLLLSPPRFQSIEISCDISIVDARLISSSVVIGNAADESNAEGKTHEAVDLIRNDTRAICSPMLLLLLLCLFLFPLLSKSINCKNAWRVTRMRTPGKERERYDDQILLRKRAATSSAKSCSSSFSSGYSNWIHRLLWPVFTRRSCGCGYALSIQWRISGSTPW